YTPLPLGTVTTTSFVDTGLVNHVTYYYVVSASNSFGESPDSTEVSAAGALKAVQVAAGSNGAAGLFGNSSTADSIVPVQALGLPPIVQLDLGGTSAFALDADGRIWSWGLN